MKTTEDPRRNTTAELSTEIYGWTHRQQERKSTSGKDREVVKQKSRHVEVYKNKGLKQF